MDYSVEQIISEYDRLSTERSAIDKSISDLYHIIEYAPLNAVQLVKTTIAIREALKTRRKIKEQFIHYQRLKDILVPALRKLESNDRASVREETYRQESIESAKRFGLM